MHDKYRTMTVMLGNKIDVSIYLHLSLAKYKNKNKFSGIVIEAIN